MTRAELRSRLAFDGAARGAIPAYLIELDVELVDLASITPSVRPAPPPRAVTTGDDLRRDQSSGGVWPEPRVSPGSHLSAEPCAPFRLECILKIYIVMI
jgi:hypothetical protein